MPLQDLVYSAILLCLEHSDMDAMEDSRELSEAGKLFRRLCRAAHRRESMTDMWLEDQLNEIAEVCDAEGDDPSMDGPTGLRGINKGIWLAIWNAVNHGDQSRLFEWARSFRR